MRSRIAILSLLGMVIAGYLTATKLAGAAPYCAGIGSCEAVNASPYSVVLGVPVALLGFGAYLIIFGLALLPRWQPQYEFQADLALFGVALVGTLYSAYLTYVELFVLYEICLWCVASAIVITLIAALAFWQLQR